MSARKFILITGANGFIGRNLFFKLNSKPDYEILTFGRSESLDQLSELIGRAELIVHLAGENRPDDPKKFKLCNVDLTTKICKLLIRHKKNIPFIFASSIQATIQNPYGESKLQAEEIIRNYCDKAKATAFILRLPGVFGKWAKPYYNSVVATFCHNIANNIPITICDVNKKIDLCYIDDVVEKIYLLMTASHLKGFQYIDCPAQYTISLGLLAEKIYTFSNSAVTLMPGKVGTGIDRALYATFISNLPSSRFTSTLKSHDDERGSFVEFLKTIDSGQISYIKIKPRVIRGMHFHHTKIEKFIVVSGCAEFKFRNIITNELYKIEINSDDCVPKVVETIPGWAHAIYNIGKYDLIVLVWSNEVFNSNKPDTEACKV
jgi:UDP-2-acetamido-2,6-beta-L-arabino-hexul-4-ose reductase